VFVHLEDFNDLGMRMRTKLVVLTFATTLDVVLVGAAVAFNAVVKFADALFDVFASNVVGRVFVTAVTSGAAVVIAHMASCAAGVVVFVQNKVLVVIKGRWCPLVLRVTLQTVAGDLFVK
jgi:hypothetical protein